MGRQGMSRARRYYLHRKLRKVMRINAHSRTLFYQEDQLHSLTDLQVRYFLELVTRFKYSATQEIC